MWSSLWGIGCIGFRENVLALTEKERRISFLEKKGASLW